MKTIAELLVTHNELALKAGRTPLKVWKGSKEKLQERIEVLDPRDNPITVESLTAIKKLEDKLIEKAIKQKEESDNTLSISQIAKEVGLNPKVARAKLRRKGRIANEGRWPTVTKGSEEHKELINILKRKENEPVTNS